MNNQTSNCKTSFYCKPNGKSEIFSFYARLDDKTKAKVASYIYLLAFNQGNLGMPYARHITGKIWELRVDFNKNCLRIFYFIFDGSNIILLHGFYKKSNKAPEKEISVAIKNYNDYLINFNEQRYEFKN